VSSSRWRSDTSQNIVAPSLRQRTPSSLTNFDDEEKNSKLRFVDRREKRILQSVEELLEALITTQKLAMVRIAMTKWATSRARYGHHLFYKDQG